jgi:hypothetical protein
MAFGFCLDFWQIIDVTGLRRKQLTPISRSKGGHQASAGSIGIHLAKAKADIAPGRLGRTGVALSFDRCAVKQCHNEQGLKRTRQSMLTDETSDCFVRDALRNDANV